MGSVIPLKKSANSAYLELRNLVERVTILSANESKENINKLLESELLER